MKENQVASGLLGDGPQVKTPQEKLRSVIGANGAGQRKKETWVSWESSKIRNGNRQHAGEKC